MAYVNGMVVSVPNAKKDAFVHHARIADDYFKENGALRVVECWGADVPAGKVTSFPMAVKANEDETVVFSWIEWPSREVADAAINKMMDDPRFDPKTNLMPFDGQRMIFGGFEPVIDI